MKKYLYEDFAKRKGVIAINESVDKQGYETHIHDFFEIVYIKKGEGFYTENDKTGSVSWGDIIMVSPMDCHSLQPVTNDFTWINCLFLPERIYPETSSNCTAAQLLSLPCFPGERISEDCIKGGILISQKSREFQGIMNSMLNEYYQAREGFAEILKYYLHILLIKIKRNIEKNVISEPQKNSRESFLKLMEHFLPESNALPAFKLSAVAQAAGLTPKYFSQVFKKKVGVTYSQYVQEKRLNIAALMLTTGTASVKSIMEYVGYNDYKTFYTLFKARYGLSPAAYRKDFQRQQINKNQEELL